ncbi:MAG: HD domain-containing protein [Pyrinomonadaceae bacterium]
MTGRKCAQVIAPRRSSLLRRQRAKEGGERGLSGYRRWLGAESEKYCGLFEEYEERQSLEAKLVEAADVIDLLAQALTFERAGARGLDEFWQERLLSDQI